MSRKSNAVEVVCQPTEILVDGLADLLARQIELRTKKRLLMEVEARNAWEQTTKALNPGYVVGSLRPATPDDDEVLGHTHGFVASIICESCGDARLVNKQDARQVRQCKTCKRATTRARNKERRVAKRLAGVSREDLERQINELDQQLAKLS